MVLMVLEVVLVVLEVVLVVLEVTGPQVPWGVFQIRLSLSPMTKGALRRLKGWSWSCS